MKKRLFVLALLCMTACSAFAQKPKNGKYKFRIAYWEWGSKPRDLTCEVIIRGDSIFVNGNEISEGNGSSAIDAGILMFHKKSGKWIIGHKPSDRNAPRVGGCEEGPTVVDFKKKQVWLC